MTTEIDLHDAQNFVNGPWKHSAAALEACRTGAWMEFVREVAPTRPRLLGRRDHSRCIEACVNSLSEPTTTRLTFTPVWACSAFELPSDEWVAAHAMSENDSPCVIKEYGPHHDEPSNRFDVAWSCEVRVWHASIVVETQYYAPSVPLRIRAGSFGVLDTIVYEVLSVEVHDSEPLPMPEAEVGMFCTSFEPRVVVSDARAESIRALGWAPDDAIAM